MKRRKEDWKRKKNDEKNEERKNGRKKYRKEVMDERWKERSKTGRTREMVVGLGVELATRNGKQGREQGRKK